MRKLEEFDYKKAYEREQERSEDLADRVVLLESEKEDLQFQLDRIKNNKLWKLTKPVRGLIHFGARQMERLSHCGGPKDIARKIAAKRRQKSLMKSYGTGSFPTPEQAEAQRNARFERMIKISILVPLWNTPREFLREMLDSVMNQTYRNWELCLADGSDEEHAYVGEVCREYQEKSEGRILYRKLEKNEGISGNTNQCFAMSTGEYIGLFDHDDILHPSVLYEYVKAVNEQGADYLYCDETTFQSGNIDKMLTMHFKPDYALDNLRANNYICHFSVFARKLLEGEELFRTDFDGSQDHDMILRLTDRAERIVHVPKLMYYWRSHADSTASGIGAKPYAIEAAKGAVADHLRHHGFSHFVITSTRACETIFRIRYRIQGSPKISILIPNKDHAEDLRRCVSSILEKSTYENYEILILENNSETSEIREYYSRLLGYDYARAAAGEGTDGMAEKGSAAVGQEGFSGPERETKSCGPEDGDCLRSRNGRTAVVTYRGRFNYSAVNNLGEKYASGDYILLLNNDTEVITSNWMEELLMYAQREDVGAAGAKLYYPDGTIQHAGVVLGLGAHRTAGHSHYRVPKQNLGYMGRLCYAQNVSAVTGACLLVKKSLYEEVGGLDEGFEISLNDVDFCLKLREKGLLNVWTPFAELYHYESVSRGADDQGEKAERYNRESERFRQKWKKVLAAGDPYYNPNFSLDRSDFSLRGNQQQTQG